MLCESEREGEREVVGMPLFCEEMGNGWDWRFCCCCIAHYILFLLLMGEKGFINVYILPFIVLPCLLNIYWKDYDDLHMTYDMSAHT